MVEEKGGGVERNERGKVYIFPRYPGALLRARWGSDAILCAAVGVNKSRYIQACKYKMQSSRAAVNIRAVRSTLMICSLPSKSRG